MTEQTEPSVESVIAAYTAFRGKRERLKASYEEEDKKIKAKMTAIEVYLQDKMIREKVNSFNTDAGTAYKSTVEHASVVDMDAMLDYVRKNDAWYLIEKRVSKTGVRSLLDEGQPLPPGVNWYTSTAIHVRKPTER